MSSAKNQSHENFDRLEKTKQSSEKSFGITFGILFLLLAFAPLFIKHSFRLWAFVASLIFFIAAFAAPNLLKTLNRLWTQFGLLLNRIISPLVLAVLFYLIFAPMGFLLKLFKKDILDLKLDKIRHSYWIKSDSQLSSMKDQF